MLLTLITNRHFDCDVLEVYRSSSSCRWYYIEKTRNVKPDVNILHIVTVGSMKHSRPHRLVEEECRGRDRPDFSAPTGTLIGVRKTASECTWYSEPSDSLYQLGGCTPRAVTDLFVKVTEAKYNPCSRCNQITIDFRDAFIRPHASCTRRPDKKRSTHICQRL
jgi:hypothetical protein